MLDERTKDKNVVSSHFNAKEWLQCQILILNYRKTFLDKLLGLIKDEFNDKQLSLYLDGDT